MSKVHFRKNLRRILPYTTSGGTPEESWRDPKHVGSCMMPLEQAGRVMIENKLFILQHVCMETVKKNTFKHGLLQCFDIGFACTE